MTQPRQGTNPRSPTPDQLQPTKPVDSDDRRWSTEAADARHSGLKSVRDTADAWGKSISAVLGVFALVSFVKGPDVVSAIPTGSRATFHLFFLTLDPARTVVAWIFIAAAMILVAVITAAIAAEGTPAWEPKLDGRRFRTLTEGGEKRAIKWLLISRILTLLGAFLVFCAMALAWTATIDKLSKPQVVMASTKDAVVCGELRSRPDGSIEVVSVGGATSVLAAGTDITPVDSCPASP
jgi:hypothetical protein